MSKPAYLYDFEPECAKCGDALDELYPFCTTCAYSIKLVNPKEEK